MSYFSHKVALITGAAEGTGTETARSLARQGARLILVELDAAALSALAAEIGERHALAQTADVRDLAAMERAVAAGVARFGRLDLVLANAGETTHGSILEGDPDAFQHLVEVNIIGVFHTVRAALPALIESQGYILIVSSLAAYVASPGAAAYDSSQAGVERFASILRLEVAHLGVDVGSAHVSWLDGPLSSKEMSPPRSFPAYVDRLPAPERRESSTRACAMAFTQGLQQRRRQVNVG